MGLRGYPNCHWLTFPRMELWCPYKGLHGKQSLWAASEYEWDCSRFVCWAQRIQSLSTMRHWIAFPRGWVKSFEVYLIKCQCGYLWAFVMTQEFHQRLSIHYCLQEVLFPLFKPGTETLRLSTCWSLQSKGGTKVIFPPCNPFLGRSDPVPLN